MSEAAPVLPERPTARWLILDGQGRVLLFHFVFSDGPLSGTAFWATPGGGADSGETYEDAARRELFEETGFTAATMKAILTGPPSPGISDEMVTFYRARGMVRTASGGGRGAERIRTHVVPVSWLSEWLDQMQAKGYLVDPKVFAGAHWLRQEMDMWMHD